MQVRTELNSLAMREKLESHEQSGVSGRGSQRAQQEYGGPQEYQGGGMGGPAQQGGGDGGGDGGHLGPPSPGGPGQPQFPVMHQATSYS